MCLALGGAGGMYQYLSSKKKKDAEKNKANGTGDSPNRPIQYGAPGGRQQYSGPQSASNQAPAQGY